MTKEEFIKYCEKNIEKFSEKLNSRFLEDRIFNLTDTQLDIFNKIIAYALQYNTDWVPNAARFLNLIRNEKYQALIKSLEGKNLTFN